MPKDQPSARKRHGDVMNGVGSGGQVFDLATAVKDGILGAGGGARVKDSITPSLFICPISLEPMQDPVTLCTGQTYERSNILKWISLCHFTCPTTMQELWNDDVTPNTTLHHLIQSWFSQNYLNIKKRSEDVEGRVLDLLDTLKKVKGQKRIEALKEMRTVVTAHDSAKKTVVDNGGVSFISSLLGPFTTHALGSESIGILVNLELSSDSVFNLRQPTRVSLIVDLMNEGSTETKLDCTNLMEILLKDSGSEIVSSLSLLVGIMRLVKDKRSPNVAMSGLRLLKQICSCESVRSSIVSIGAVPQLVEILPNSNRDYLELALFILEALSTIPEGKLALKDCSNTIPILVKLLMRVSESCTQLALSILWAVCGNFPEECVAIAVELGLPAKLLLVIQSGCIQGLKQRASEFLKLCSLNYSASLFISKCKLTKTIQ